MMKVIIAGHLGADVETRYTEKGQKVSSMRIAANYRRTGKDETVWWRVTLWGDQYDGIMPYLKKGTGVIVTGDFTPKEIYIDRDGKPQMSLEINAKSIEFSPFGRSDKAGQEGSAPGQAARPAYSAGSSPSSSSHAHEEPSSAYSASYTVPPAPSAPAGHQAPRGEYPAQTEDVPF